MKFNNASKVLVAGVMALGIGVAVSTFAGTGNPGKGSIQLAVNQVGEEVSGKTIPTPKQGVAGIPVAVRCGGGKEEQIRELKTSSQGKALAYNLTSENQKDQRDCVASVALLSGYRLDKSKTGSKGMKLGSGQRENVTWNVIKVPAPAGSLEEQAKKAIPDGAAVTINLQDSAEPDGKFQESDVLLIDRKKSETSKCAFVFDGKLVVYDGDLTSSDANFAEGKVMSFGFHTNFVRCSSGTYVAKVVSVKKDGHLRSVDPDEVTAEEFKAGNWLKFYEIPITVANNMPVVKNIKLKQMTFPVGGALYYVPVK